MSVSSTARCPFDYARSKRRMQCNKLFITAGSPPRAGCPSPSVWNSILLLSIYIYYSLSSTMHIFSTRGLRLQSLVLFEKYFPFLIYVLFCTQYHSSILQFHNYIALLAFCSPWYLPERKNGAIKQWKNLKKV